ncbi:hypothetical protein D3C73_641550 [compost metagenome]
MQVLAQVVENHQLSKKRIAHAHGTHPQPPLVARCVQDTVAGHGYVVGKRCGGDRNALFAGQAIGEAVIHQPGAKPFVAADSAIQRPTLDLLVHADPRQPASTGCQPGFGVVLVKRAIDHPHILEQKAPGCAVLNQPGAFHGPTGVLVGIKQRLFPTGDPLQLVGQVKRRRCNGARAGGNFPGLDREAFQGRRGLAGHSGIEHVFVCSKAPLRWAAAGRCV